MATSDTEQTSVPVKMGSEQSHSVVCGQYLHWYANQTKISQYYP